MPPDQPRSPQLEGLRAVAAGMVFLTHVASMTTFTSHSPAGPLFARFNLGVALFFVLSAYLLYRPWVAARLEGRKAPAPGRYALRRVTRIFPAYWLALGALAIVLPATVEGAAGPDWWVYFGLLQVYSADWIFGGLTVAWSLSTEVAFYAALPALGYAGVRAIGRRTRRDQVVVELAALALSAAAALVVREIAYRAEWGQTFNNTLLGKWPWFAVGMALAVLGTAWAGDRWASAPRLVRSARERPWAWWAAAALVLLVSSLEGVLPREVFAMDHGDLQLELILFALFAGLLAAPLVFGDAAARMTPAGLLAIRPVVWLGTVSYGLFLWHVPLIDWTIGRLPGAPVWLIGLVSLALSLACASASWYLLERPLLRATRRPRGRRPGRGQGREAVAPEPAR